MKIIAWHLPQFHTIPENDEWWEKGFTEWTNTKKAKPLFKDHFQPNEPLEDNYYNLLEKKTMEWQCELSQKYGIYGFCYYHYWFNGKMLLEKPVENLLNWKDINQKFCFSWANEPWARTWDGQNKNILMEQHYGGENEWKEHFYYLLEFFKDSRYIKIKNKPLFLIYRTESIPRCNEMILYWKKLAIKEGLEGIHIIETLNGFQDVDKCKNSDGIVYMEPMLTLKERGNFEKIIDRIRLKLKKPLKKKYDLIWNRIVERKYVKKENKSQYLGAFVSWDNTPRKKEKGLIITENSPEKFQFYLNKQKKKLEELGEEILFINAWNEWAEGTYLEPDKRNKYKYLESIKNVLEENN